MDPVCHTLVGATLARTGLERRTALGTATLVIGANLPDVDVFSYFAGSVTALSFRRGVTHGALALVVLPFVLSGVMLLWDRLVRRRGGRSACAAAVPGQLMLLAVLATATHLLLDFMNVYGMRWLMPFSGQWFYGDTLFIVDPWVWAVLTAGLVLAHRRRRTGPALTALGTLAAYIIVMGASNLAARSIVRSEAAERLGRRPDRIMAGPVPLNPLRRWVVVESDDAYSFAGFDWLGRTRLEWRDHAIDKFPENPVAMAATRGPEVRKFLAWARFPFFVVERRSDRQVVYVGDARYTLDPAGSWAAVSIEVPD